MKTLRLHPANVLLISCVTLFAQAVLAADPPAQAKVSFSRDIQPIMSDTCFHCHGPDAKAREADLRLDIREEALKKIESGAIPIVPGKPDASEIITRIFATDEDDIMPPPKAHKELTKAQKDMFRRWVAEGAKYEAHWAYTPLARPAVPVVKDMTAVRNPIDPFIQEKLDEKGVKPSAEADKATLLRRLSLDLIGLPPTPEEVKAFLADKSDKACERQVERLLASPHFGERWAAWWLDVARFSDTVGFHGDQNQRIFPYRDYVIAAFNQNKRFDQFTVEQLAGDLLPNPTTEQIVATGFNRLNMVTREGGAQPKEYLAKYGAERVRTIGGTWMGATLGCAECHDHKFDPFTARDFYSMQAFFADVKQWGYYADASYAPNPELKGFGNEHPFPPEIEVGSPYLQQRAAKLRAELSGIAAAASTSIATDAKAKAAFIAWRAAGARFFTENPTGWATPAPAVTTASATPANKKGKPPTKAGTKKDANSQAAKPPVAAKPPDAKPVPPSFTVEPGGRVVFHTKSAEAVTFKMQPGAIWVSAIRVELLPHERHQGGIVRGGASSSMTLQLTASVRKAGAGKDSPIAFRHADADLKEPRYKDGEEAIGILGGWRTSANDSSKPQTAFWLASQPVSLAEGDLLTVKLDGCNAGCVRVSVSPFAPQRPLASDAMTAIHAALTNDAASSRKLLNEAWLAGTGWDAGAFARYTSLYAKLLECRDGRAWTMVTKKTQPLTVRVLARGNWMEESGEVRMPASPAFLPHPAGSAGKRLTRLDLAKWLCSPENPLTPRAVMNRLWKQFFGNGISAVVDDLGAQGEPPSHPELLDWLGVEFRESGWDFKHMLRTIVTSATYRQSSSLRPEMKDIDPNNRLLASQNPRRLDAEFVRDNALFAAGILNLNEIGGPSVKPYQPGGYYANLQFPNREYAADVDDRQWRRGVYMHWQRTFLHPMLANFDAPMRDECTANRIVSNTPQQALTLLNDPTFVEAARAFAAKLLTSGEKSDEARIDLAFQRAVARPAKSKEKDSLAKFIAEQRAYFRANPQDAGKLLKVGLAPQPQAIESAEMAAWATLCRVVLNLQETITRY